MILLMPFRMRLCCMQMAESCEASTVFPSEGRRGASALKQKAYNAIEGSRLKKGCKGRAGNERRALSRVEGGRGGNPSKVAMVLRSWCAGCGQVQGWEDSSIFTGLAVYWVALVLAYVLAGLYLLLAILFIVYRSRAPPPKSVESPEGSKPSTSSQAGLPSSLLLGQH